MRNPGSRRLGTLALITTFLAAVPLISTDPIDKNNTYRVHSSDCLLELYLHLYCKLGQHGTLFTVGSSKETAQSYGSTNMIVSGSVWYPSLCRGEFPNKVPYVFIMSGILAFQLLAVNYARILKTI